MKVPSVVPLRAKKIALLPPLALALHWTLNADGSYEADAIGLDVINDIFYEDSPLSCNITLTEDGYVDAINFDCAAAGYSDGTCTAKVINIGTTNYTGPQA